MIMEIEDRYIDSIKPYSRNPRRNDTAVAAVADSIKRYGFRQPIVVDLNGIIVVGHTRYKAAKKLGMTKVPVVVMKASKAKIAQYRLADNGTHDLSEWNGTFLSKEIKDIIGQVVDLDSIPGIDLTQFVGISKAQTKELKPYSKIHILISCEVSQIDRIQQLIDSLNLEGIEIEKSAN